MAIIQASPTKGIIENMLLFLAICETKNYNFRDFTKISILVEQIQLNGNTLSINEDLFMTLLHSGFEVPIRAGGKIVRVDPKGMGCKVQEHYTQHLIYPFGK